MKKKSVHVTALTLSNNQLKRIQRSMDEYLDDGRTNYYLRLRRLFESQRPAITHKLDCAQIVTIRTKDDFIALTDALLKGGEPKGLVESLEIKYRESLDGR